MRSAAYAPLLLLAFCLVVHADDQKKPGDAIKVDAGFLEKTYGVSYKSYSIADYKAKGLKKEYKEVKIVLEFARDAENVAEMQRVFGGQGITGGANAPLLFYCFDADNALLLKAHVYQGEGEMTGKKGDAFRVLVRVPDRVAAKIAKVEARPGDTPPPVGK